MNKIVLPEKGCWYFCYDDGKINLGRLCKVKILAIIPFEDASEALLKDWYKNFDNDSCPLFNETTPCFIKTHLINNDEPPIYFALMQNKTCFYSFQRPKNCYWSSNLLLDIDGKFTEQIINAIETWTKKDYYQECQDLTLKDEHKKIVDTYAGWQKQFIKNI
jgi:hypothetical protein